MQVNNVDLTISAVEPKQYPATNYQEIALVGRSNVGKSSLTNVLINRRNFAHTSSQPGKTQTLNFYNVEDELYFVDGINQQQMTFQCISGLLIMIFRL